MSTINSIQNFFDRSKTNLQISTSFELVLCLQKQESGQLNIFIPQISTDLKPTIGDTEINEIENRSNADEQESRVGESLQAQANSTSDPGVPAMQPRAGQDRPFSIDSVDVP